MSHHEIGSEIDPLEDRRIWTTIQAFFDIESFLVKEVLMTASRCSDVSRVVRVLSLSRGLKINNPFIMLSNDKARLDFQKQFQQDNNALDIRVDDAGKEFFSCRASEWNAAERVHSSFHPPLDDVWPLEKHLLSPFLSINTGKYAPVIMLMRPHQAKEFTL
ncbi:hypothetical protein JTE90_019253 [Oedothorax gibbosus]|uniref:Uncharacterized protein n=1 Tax=Oedothorax gibbosus TaxID=931172 RepID=A0AAV6UTT3_9ARAC|nr:hypothetical protein JTE90_019253 [Oedothorax gibbosus]